jgi:hypothetical protein
LTPGNVAYPRALLSAWPPADDNPKHADRPLAASAHA